jgi:hypothetical protein
LILKYGSAQLSFWKPSNHSTHHLREISIIYQPNFEPLPEILSFTDWDLAGPPTEPQFDAFLKKIDYLPVHRVDGPGTRQLAFLSGVTVFLAEKFLHTIRLSQRETKESSPTNLSDEREPTTTQILDMFEEADRAMRSGADRAALLMAWAGLEAVLRRTALRAGRQGKIGVQPAILIRELFAAGKLTPAEHSSIEELRQLRTVLAHGLAPMKFDSENIPKISAISKRLLDAVNDR